MEDRRHALWIAVLASIGNFLQGCDNASLAGSLLFLVPALELSSSPSTVGLIAATALLGAAPASLASGVLSDSFGRRPTLISASLLFFSGEVAQLLCGSSLSSLLLARSMIGCAVGLATSTIPIYISECSPADVRGQLAAIPQLMGILGMITSYSVQLPILWTMDQANWHWMLCIGLFPSAIYSLLLIFVAPESPPCLVLKRDFLETSQHLPTSTKEDSHPQRLKAPLLEEVSVEREGEESCSSSSSSSQEWGHECTDIMSPDLGPYQPPCVQTDEGHFSPLAGSCQESIPTFLADVLVTQGRTCVPQGTFRLDPNHPTVSLDTAAEPFRSDFGVAIGSDACALQSAEAETRNAPWGQHHSSTTECHCSGCADHSAGSNVVAELPVSDNLMPYPSLASRRGPTEPEHCPEGGVGRLQHWEGSSSASSPLSSPRKPKGETVPEEEDIEKQGRGGASCAREAWAQDAEGKCSGQKDNPSYFQLLMKRKILSALFISMGLQALQQACGTTAVISFLPKLLLEPKTPPSSVGSLGAYQAQAITSTVPERAASLRLGFDLTDRWRNGTAGLGMSWWSTWRHPQESKALLAGGAIVFLMAPCAVLCMPLLDSLGRRWLLLRTMPLVAACLFCASSAIAFLPHGTISQTVETLFLALYCCFFSMGLGPIPNILSSEIFPRRIRGVCMSLSAGAMWTVAILFNALEPSLENLLGPSGVLRIYGVAALATLSFVYLLVPETKGVPLDDLAVM